MKTMSQIKHHPQRSTALLLVVFSSLQASLTMFQAHMPPLYFAAVTTVIGLVMAVLAWKKSNEEPTQPFTQEPNDETP